ncbi:hypothetical protein ACROYT_G003284 [Oculina patagonica]
MLKSLRSAMLKGFHSKPTPRSETARLSSSVFKGFGNDEVLLNAWIVTLFKEMAVMHKKAFKTMLTMYDEHQPLASESVGWYSCSSSQRRFFMIFKREMFS